jgi:hypothetical protein
MNQTGWNPPISQLIRVKILLLKMVAGWIFFSFCRAPVSHPPLSQFNRTFHKIKLAAITVKPSSPWTLLRMHADQVGRWHPHLIGNIIRSPKCSRNTKRVATWYLWRVLSWWRGFHLIFEAPCDCDFHGEYVGGGNFSTITNSWPWEFLEGVEHGSWESLDALLAYLFWDCITEAI